MQGASIHLILGCTDQQLDHRSNTSRRARTSGPEGGILALQITDQRGALVGRQRDRKYVSGEIVNDFEVLPWYYPQHADIFERLGVPCEETPAGDWLCKFTAPTIRAYQLLHVLLHELGHHHDRMTTRSKRRSSRGEPYAERYARDYQRIIWDRYLDVFGLD